MKVPIEVPKVPFVRLMTKTNNPPVPPLNPPCVVWNRNDPDGSIAMVIGLALLAEPPASSVSAPFALMDRAIGAAARKRVGEEEPGRTRLP